MLKLNIVSTNPNKLHLVGLLIAIVFIWQWVFTLAIDATHQLAAPIQSETATVIAPLVPIREYATPTSLASAEMGPGFAVKFSNGSFLEYSTSINDDKISANLVDQGNGNWELQVLAKQNIDQVWFPYEINPEPLGETADDDLVYYPLLTGFAYRNQIATVGEWQTDGVKQVLEPCYPGNCFSPIVILADDNMARLVAATNWPPKYATPVWSRSKLAIKYHERINSGQAGTYQVSIKRVNADTMIGEKPWQLVADSYKQWLKEQMSQASLYPLPYPNWLKQSHGWLHVPVNDMKNFNIEFIEQKWEKWKHIFPWLQIWGQMSDWSGSIYELALPGTGCCLLKHDIHPRYLPSLLELATKIKRAGGQIGYYARPNIDGNGIRPLDESVNLEWLQRWLEKSENDYGANAFYIDVLGAEPAGDPLTVARLFKTVFPPATVIEWPVDIYPTAYLMGGSLWRDGGPGINPGTVSAASYPNFGRYILDDRIFFSGYSNGDFYTWGSGLGGPGIYNFFGESRGTNRSCIDPPTVGKYCEPYWTERQTFLLGAKFDLEEVADDPKYPDIMNPAVRLTVSERDRVNWWAREPRYLDTKGVSEVRSAVDIRRFIDRSGVTLLALDNWSAVAKIGLKLDGRSLDIDVPLDSLTGQPRQLFIFEATTAPPPPPISEITPSQLPDSIAIDTPVLPEPESLSEVERITALKAQVIELMKILINLLKQKLNQLLILRGWR